MTHDTPLRSLITDAADAMREYTLYADQAVQVVARECWLYRTYWRGLSIDGRRALLQTIVREYQATQEAKTS